MNPSHRTVASDQGPVQSAIADYFGRLDRGEPVDLAELIAAHPGCEAGLRQFLQQERVLHALAGGSPVDDAPSGKVIGDFRLVGELGRGGMGVVYEAEQLSLGRRVALKVLPFAAMLNKQQLARFKNEARAAATLDHPHIVAVHSVGSEGDVHYYAMQLIAGRSLADVIAELRRATHRDAAPSQVADANLSTDDQERSTVPNGIKPPSQPDPIQTPQASGGAGDRLPLPEFASRDFFRTVARLGREAATALDHAHQSGVLHRDVKPANLLVDEAGKLWIADFGLARMETDASLTMTGDMLGTLRYMAPEQAAAERAVVDHRCDVYSLGATLYELLTLEPAFGETDRALLLQQIARDEPLTPRKHEARIPRDLETIVLKAMRKSPEERYATAQALADDLQNFLDDKPIAAKPPTRRERVVKWSRRHPAAVMSTGAVLVAVTIAAAASAVVVAQAYRRETVQRGIAEAQTRRAESEREAAERNFERARNAIQEIVLNAANGEGVWFHLSSDMRRVFSNHASNFYESMLQEKSSDPALLLETAVGYQSLAGLQKDNAQAETLYRRSLEILNRLCREHPNVASYMRECARTHYRFAEFLARLDERTDEQRAELDTALQTAIALYEDTLEAEPDQTWFFFNEVNDCFARLEGIRRARGDASWDMTNECLALYRDAARRAPESWAARDFIGTRLLSRGEFDDAIVVLREAVRVGPDEIAPNFNLSVALERKGLWDEAIAVMRNIVRVHSYNAMSQGRLGYLLTEVGQTDEAVAAYREAARLEPRVLHYHSELGLLLEKEGLWDEAITVYRAAIRLNSDDANADAYIYIFHLGIARALNDKGLLDEAIVELRTASQLPVASQDDASHAEFLLGRTLARRGQYEEAVAILRKLLDRDPDNHHHRYLLANVLRASGQTEKANQEIEVAIEGYRQIINHDSALDLFCLARMLICCPESQLYDPEEAVTLASRVVELTDGDDHDWHILGRARFRAANYSDAVEALLRACELGGEDAYSYFYLAMAEWQLGNADAARKWYDKAINWLEQRPQIVGGELILLRAEAEELLGMSVAADQ